MLQRKLRGNSAPGPSGYIQPSISSSDRFAFLLLFRLHIEKAKILFEEIILNRLSFSKKLPSSLVSVFHFSLSLCFPYLFLFFPYFLTLTQPHTSLPETGMYLSPGCAAYTPTPEMQNLLRCLAVSRATPHFCVSQRWERTKYLNREEGFQQ